jgi:hypothetical protein
VPRVGLTFESEDAAYNLYSSYARRIGFSIIKCHVKHRASDGTLASKYMVCSNEGLKNCNQTHLTKKEHASTRSECKARVQFFISPECIWRMQKVELAHNHPFVSPNKTHMLRSQRRMLPADEHIISKMREAGVKPAEIFEFFQLWSGGAENVQLLQMDCNNFIGRERKKYLESQDAKTLLEYLENKQVEDPSFFYAVELDPEEDGRICNFFWAPLQIMLALEMLSVLTPLFKQISLKCLLPLLLEQIITDKLLFFGAALLFNENSTHLSGCLKPL